MKHLIISCLFVLSMMVPVHAQTQRQGQASCEKVLAAAETKDIDWVYGMCGLDDETSAWRVWAPIASRNGYRKALFYLSQKHPTHEYANLYLEKSAAAGYVPAQLLMAEQAKKEGNMTSYTERLNQIVDQNPLAEKTVAISLSDRTAVRANRDLGLAYLTGEGAPKDPSRAEAFLKTAADLNDPVAAHALAVLYLWSNRQDKLADSGNYWWRAIINGCPSAEETLGLQRLFLKQQISRADAQREMEKRIGTCQRSRTVPQEKAVVLSECKCADLLSWYQTQGSKPYQVISIDGGTAVLRDARGNNETVSKGKSTAAGYFIDEVRPSAVILRSTRERVVILYRSDIGCLSYCQEENAAPIRSTADMATYQLVFTPEECQNLAAAVEMLDNPDEPFRGLKECQLIDWARWGKEALAKKRNKHLYVMHNYGQSAYIPAYLKEVERLMESDGAQDKQQINSLLVKASRQQPNDSLSALRREQAACIRAYLYMTGTAEGQRAALQAASEGADLGYASSMNMLGVIYATGLGTTADPVESERWFKRAIEASNTIYLDALHNLKVLQSGQNFDTFKYGGCKNIAEPVQPTRADLQVFY